MKLALGTVQFGLDYGVANQTGLVPETDVKQILDLCRNEGIDTLDTAVAYGSSEANLGLAGIDGWHVVTKLPALPENLSSVYEWVLSTIETSFSRLKQEKVDAILLHRAEDLLSPHGQDLWSALAALKQRGLCNRIGISVYSPDLLDQLPDQIKPDLVQAPFNVFDRRLEDTGWANKLADQGTAIHLRSIFLQGALVMPAKARPSHFAPFQSYFSKWERYLRESGQTGVAAALGHALSRQWTEKVIVGVDSAAQLREIAASAKAPVFAIPDDMGCADPALIDPSTWPRS